MRSDVVAGLSGEPKRLAPKYFYDERGSHLFEDITRLPEYYLTRTESQIMETWLPEMAKLIGPKAAVIEFGSGSGEKIRRLLRHLEQPVACVPVEISRSHLLESAEGLARDFPELDVVAICADFTQPFDLPKIRNAQRNLVFFPGSTIGNFEPDQAVRLLKVMRQVAGKSGALLIGVDLAKDRATLEAAYNDSQGVTAQFNRNLLRRINRELNADFDLNAFSHVAEYNEEKRRIEMYLVSEKAQQAHIGTHRFMFKRGERILTEYAHKHDADSFAELVGKAGFSVAHTWTDENRWFSVQYLVGG
ncbi:MAG: L-histidine N(alpha)-methyltransferase [Xanthomonadales bacterium]|nr:L-histidine N(alpha)-methyltransferase [Xanthomonadales bacterium]